MKRMLKYIRWFQAPNHVPYIVLEQDFQDDMVSCGLANIGWNNTFEKYNIGRRSLQEGFTEEEINNSSLELLGAMLTSVHRRVTHWEESNLLEHKDFFVKALHRLEVLLNEPENTAARYSRADIKYPVS